MTLPPATNECVNLECANSGPTAATSSRRIDGGAKSPRTAGPRALAGLMLLLSLFGLVACTNTNTHSCANHVETFGGTLVMEPGGTGLCRAGPCLVQLRMPPGTASYEVLADGVSLGRFPAGETVTLGEFSSRKTFVVKATGAYPATLYVQ